MARYYKAKGDMYSVLAHQVEAQARRTGSLGEEFHEIRRMYCMARESYEKYCTLSYMITEFLMKVAGYAWIVAIVLILLNIIIKTH